MKHIYHLFIVLVCFSQTVFSQAYEPLVRENAHWVVVTLDYGNVMLYEDFREYHTSGDTIISDTMFKKVYRYQLEPDYFPNPPYHRISDPILYGAIREDTVERKVYGRRFNVPSYSCFGGTGAMMFDYSVTTGDSIDLCAAVFGPFKIDTVIYEEVFGYTRKNFYPQSPYNYSSPLIEGIGSWHGLFEEIGYAVKDSDVYVLLCYTIGNASGCDVITGERETIENQIEIFPNPVKGSFLNVKLAEAETGIFKADLDDIYGRTIQYYPLNHSFNQLNLEPLPQGIYILKIYQKQKVLSITKILKQ